MENSKLIESLENCVTACNHCASSCLREDNVEAMTGCIALDLDCADICNTTLKLLARNGGNINIRMIEICRDTCAECAEECEKHGHEHCQQCARACRRCEEHCRNYLNQ